MTIVRVVVAQVFTIEPVWEFLQRVCTHFRLPHAACLEICNMCARPNVQILLGIENHGPVALLVTQLPSPLMLLPTILLGYNSGSRALGHEMMAQAGAFARLGGYDRVLLVNRSGRSDAAYARGLGRVGIIKDRMTVFEVELKEECA